MEDYQRLKKLLTKTPYLVADASTGKITLVRGAEAFELMTENPGGQVIINAKRGLDEFAELAGRQRSFKLPEIAKIMGVSYHVAYDLVRQGVLQPAVAATGQGRYNAGEYSWACAFTAGIVGSLRRLGLPFKSCAEVQRLLEGENDG